MKRNVIQIQEFCSQNGVRRLMVFGSSLRGKVGRESDLDLLVEFERGRRVGFLDLARMQIELDGIFGRKTDLRTPAELSPYFRRRVLAEARALYVHG